MNPTETTENQNYELEEVPQENQKQQLSDTFITFSPKNSSGYTTKGHVIEVQIPRTEHSIALAKSYIYLDLSMGFKFVQGDKISNLQDADYANDGDYDFYVGMINAATIFDQVRISNNGKVILSDTFAQVNSRIWQMTKSSQYLKANVASFINIDNVSLNEGFILHKLDENNLTAGTVEKVTYKMKIPLPCLFNCFDNANNFSTSNLTDDITLTMQLSFLNRYLVLVKADKNTGRVISINPFDTRGNGYIEITAHNADSGAQVISAIQVVEKNGTDEIYRIEDNLRIVCPAHYPTPTEANALTGLIDNEGVDFPYITCDIQEQKVDFAQTDIHGIGALTSKGWNKNTTSTLHYNTNTNNIFAVLMLASHFNSYCVFDKPYIENIECNLSELIKLANEKVHTEGTYYRDNDMYQDLINALGTDGFRNLERFDDAIAHDYFNHESTDENMLGSYLQYYSVACGQMLGVSADYFAHQINYKFKSKWEGETISANDDHSISWLKTTAGKNNFANSSVFCCQLTFKRLLFVNGGLDIECPMSDNYDIRRHIRGEVTGNYHGVPTAFIGPITNLIKSAGGAIRNEIYRIKRNKNTTHAYTRLGKDAYERHKAIIDENNTMGHRKFKKFIDNLIETDKQFANNSNGIIGKDPNDMGGTASTSIGPGNQQTETERGVDISMLNLNVYHKQSRNADFADMIGWKHQLVMDYKFHANIEKLRLNSWGVEAAIIGVNNSHGLVTWLKNKWNKFKSWGKEKFLPWLKDTGHKLIGNLKEIGKSYASKILNGELKISDIPSKYKDEVLKIIRNGDLTRGMDPKVQEAINMIRDIKAGKRNWSDVPGEMYQLIKSMNLESNPNGNGLVIRHGFYPGVHIKPTVPYKIMKQRTEMLLSKNPAELRDKDLRNILMYKRAKSGHGLVIRHGDVALAVRKLYGMPIYQRKLITENHGLVPKVINPYKKNMIDKYFAGDMSLYKQWKKTRKLPPHADIPPVNSPLMNQVDVNHGVSKMSVKVDADSYSEADLDKLWKANKKALKKKMMKKFLEKKNKK